MSLYCRCWASRVDGLPLHIHWGLRRGPASPVSVDLRCGSPVRRASRTFCIGPPAWTGVQACRCIVDAGPPAWTGFPCTSIGAPGVDRPPPSLLIFVVVLPSDGHPVPFALGLRRG